MARARLALSERPWRRARLGTTWLRSRWGRIWWRWTWGGGGVESSELKVERSELGLPYGPYFRYFPSFASGGQSYVEWGKGGKSKNMESGNEIVFCQGRFWNKFYG